MIDIEDIIKIRKSAIISASRRTDIPAFHMPLIVQSLKNMSIHVKLPYGKITKVSLNPQNVKCIVWWSKNYNEWIRHCENNMELFMRYRHIFNFTITGYDELETGVTSTLEERLEQVANLVRMFGSECIKYRFDPIVYYIDLADGKIKNNLEHFETIIEKIGKLHISSVIFAFCIAYPKVVSRMNKRGKKLLSLTLEQKHEILDKLIPITDKHGVRLEACCTSDVLGYKNKVFPSKCVDGDGIENILHEQIKENKKDPGQRNNCNCAISIDIGSYDMKCKHSCDYCYANPV